MSDSVAPVRAGLPTWGTWMGQFLDRMELGGSLAQLFGRLEVRHCALHRIVECSCHLCASGPIPHLQEEQRTH